jgi:hypothetical protein
VANNGSAKTARPDEAGARDELFKLVLDFFLIVRLHLALGLANRSSQAREIER